MCPHPINKQVMVRNEIASAWRCITSCNGRCCPRTILFDDLDNNNRERPLPNATPAPSRRKCLNTTAHPATRLQIKPHGPTTQCKTHAKTNMPNLTLHPTRRAILDLNITASAGPEPNKCASSRSNCNGNSHLERSIPYKMEVVCARRFDTFPNITPHDAPINSTDAQSDSTTHPSTCET